MTAILYLLRRGAIAFYSKKARFMPEDLQIKRETVLEADAETLERMRKQGHGRSG